MARYIDADKLCDSLRESYNRLFELYKKAKDNDAATICEAELNTFMECVIRAKTQPTADVVEIELLKDWLWEIALNNAGGDFSIACQDIISRLGGLRSFAKERAVNYESSKMEIKERF